MKDAADGAAPPRTAWQPFTFGGVAAFARAGLGRLLLVELVAAALFGASAVWFLRHACCPVVVQAIQEMPETARISNGRLHGIDTTFVAETKFLAIAVTPETFSQIGQSADVQIQFRPSDFRVGSVFLPDWGWKFDYGSGPALNLGRSTLDPWWGAWHPVFLAAFGVAVTTILFGIWAALALIYTFPAKLIAWFCDRELSWSGAWRMTSATMAPGAILLCAAIFLYGWRTMDMIGLAFFYVVHLVTGWVYIVGGVWASPRVRVDGPKCNPFIT